MKQAEEIQKAEVQLTKIKQELETVQKKLNKDITKKIVQKERKRKVAFNETRAIKEAFVSPITDAPAQYINGSSHLMKKELWEHSYEYQQMWYIFVDEYKKIPKIVKLSKTINRLDNEIDELEARGDYKDLTQKITDLKRNQQIRERFVENLKNVGWFRQYAKDARATEERQKKEAIITERKRIFQKKIEKEYLPLMKKSADKYINR